MSYILIADDNKDITDILSVYVKKEGYEPLIATDGVMAEDMYFKNEPVAVLLDVMMPFKDGYEVCKSIRQKSSVPIILITARGEDYDKIMGLDIGADDYIAKPFAIEELLARIEVVFRRQDSLNNSIVKFKDIVINKSSRSVKRNGNEISLTNKEYELLMILVDNKDKVVTREELLEKIWGYGYEPETNVTDVYVRYLRTKLNNENKEEYIQTVRSVGYIMRG